MWPKKIELIETKWILKNSRESTAKVYDHEGPELLKHNHDRKYLSYHHEDNEKG